MDWQFTEDRPIWQQLTDQLALRILKGEYPPGERLPGVRELAAQAGVNPNTMQKALGELMAYDSENHSHLLQTLDVYFSRSGSITEVAKQMYIHRNTCVYRLEKIKAILHDDFSNPMKLLRYQIALLALKIIEH